MLDYKLPPGRIAQHPTLRREDARMLVLHRDSGDIAHATFADVGEYLRAGDVLVANDSRVVPARLQAYKPTGGGVELLVLGSGDPDSGEPDSDEHDRVAVLYRSSKPLRRGQQLVLADGMHVSVVDTGAGGRAYLGWRGPSLATVLNNLGCVPLPPYIRRPAGACEEDRRRYQTVYAKRQGSVAAPTAGLHFSRALLARLAAVGVDLHSVTLHVGPGTFTPVRGDLDQHRMEAEWCEVPAATLEACRRARGRGGRVVAVGTTTVRSLESSAIGNPDTGGFRGRTDLFIRPGFRFRAVDALITNFHLPGTTLLALVCAFAGTQNIRRAYQEAIAREYRFYSYGDAMLIV